MAGSSIPAWQTLFLQSKDLMTLRRYARGHIHQHIRFYFRDPWLYTIYRNKKLLSYSKQSADAIPSEKCNLSNK